MKLQNEFLEKIRSVKLCLMAHPDNEQGSEFEDRINDLIEIEESLKNLPTKEEILLDALNTFGNFTSVEQEFNQNQIEVIYEAMNQVLHIAPVVGQSEQFVCRDCEKPSKEYRDQMCEPCHKWHTGS